MKARCILFTGVGSVSLADTEIPAPNADELLIETHYSCISPGTELRCLAGAQEGLGTDNFPFIPGYVLVGRVLGDGPQAGKLVLSSGARKAGHLCAWGGHVSHATVPASSLFTIPDSISAKDAGLLKLAAIAHRGFRISRLTPGENVVVVGLGVIGQLSARIFKAMGAKVLAADIAPERIETARKAGLEAILCRPGDFSAVRARLPKGAEIVVDATGFAPALKNTAELVIEKPWDESNPTPGRLVVQGSYSSDVPFPQGTAFSRELTVLWPRDNQLSDLAAVTALLAEGRLQVADLISAVHPAAEAPAVYAALRAGSKGLSTVLFSWK